MLKSNGLTESERRAFIHALLQQGWRLESGTIYSPSQGLYFSDEHFMDWSLEDFRDIFIRRAERIRLTAHKNWIRNARENQDVCDIAYELLARKKQGN